MALQSHWVLGQRVDTLATGDTTNGAYDLFHITLPPGTPGPPPHLHKDGEESFYLLSGQLELLSEGEFKAVAPGAFVQVPPDTVHTFRNPGTEPMKMLVMFQPAGFARFFHDFGTAIGPGDRGPPPVEPSTVERLLGMADEYHLEYRL